MQRILVAQSPIILQATTFSSSPLRQSRRRHRTRNSPSTRREIHLTERENGKMTLRRGFSVTPGETTLVVEDVVTTGGSTLETVKTLQAAGANVIAAASIIDRSSGKANVGVPRVALASLKVPSVDPSLCEQCRRGEPAIKPGSRKMVRQGQEADGRRR